MHAPSQTKDTQDDVPPPLSRAAAAPAAAASVAAAFQASSDVSGSRGSVGSSFGGSFGGSLGSSFGGSPGLGDSLSSASSHSRVSYTSAARGGGMQRQSWATAGLAPLREGAADSDFTAAGAAITDV